MRTELSLRGWAPYRSSTAWVKWLQWVSQAEGSGGAKWGELWPPGQGPAVSHQPWCPAVLPHLLLPLLSTPVTSQGGGEPGTSGMGQEAQQPPGPCRQSLAQGRSSPWLRSSGHSGPKSGGSVWGWSVTFPNTHLTPGILLALFLLPQQPLAVA